MKIVDDILEDCEKTIANPQETDVRKSEARFKKTIIKEYNAWVIAEQERGVNKSDIVEAYLSTMSHLAIDLLAVLGASRSSIGFLFSINSLNDSFCRKTLERATLLLNKILQMEQVDETDRKPS